MNDALRDGSGSDLRATRRASGGGFARWGDVLRGALTGLALWLLVVGIAEAAPVACTPQAGYNACVRFTYSGSAQTFTVPVGVSSLRVTMWGAGGGGSQAASFNNVNYSAGGGAGGYADGTVPVVSGTAMAVTVGQGGRTNSASGTYGRGGPGGNGANGNSIGSSGGGMSALWSGSTEFVAGTAVLIAGGGGGSAFWTDDTTPVAGGGGGTNGGSSSTTGGRGGTQTAGGVLGAPTSGSLAGTCVGGTAGSALRGGTGCSATGGTASQYEGGGGGGGGWYGGGGGMSQCSSTPNPVSAGCSYNGPGGGGSGYVGATVTGGTLATGSNASYSGNASPPNTGNSLYSPGIGTGGAIGSSAGDTAGNGVVVIQYNQVRLRLSKAWATGSNAGNVATIGATTGGTSFLGASNTSSFNSTAGTAASSAVIGVSVNNVITLPAETMSSPAGALANYATTLSCAVNSGTMASALSGTDGQTTNTLTIAAGDIGKLITCTYTNTPKTATLKLVKVWDTSSPSGHVATIGATTGGANNSAAFSAAAPASGNSGAPVTVSAGSTITFPGETFSGGAVAANYNTVLSCTADGGPTANTLSGTNGQTTNTLLIGAGDAGKAITCTYTNTPKTTTLQLVKAWGANYYGGDVASLGATSGGLNATAAFTAAAGTSGNSGTPATVRVGDAIVLPVETMSSGTLSNYGTVIACTAGGGAMASTLSGTDGQASSTLTVAATDAGKPIVCTYTNTLKTATLRLSKAWGANSISGHVATLGATTGGLNNTAPFNATATATTNGAAVTVLAGNTITLPAETMSGGMAPNYATVLSCTAAGGATANALSGTDGQASNTLLIGPGDAGKLITCAYTNTPKTATLQLSKTWGAGAISSNVARIGATTGGQNNTALFNTTAPANGASATVTVMAGNVVTLPAETMPTGNLLNYTTTLSCTTDGGTGTTANALSGTNGQTSNTLQIDPADAGKAIVCTYTNNPKTATLKLVKAWDPGSTTGHAASIGATTGGANNTTAFTAIAPAGGDSGTPVTVSAGNTITFPAESMSGGGSLTNYTTTLSCTTDNGPTTNTLTGANGQVATNKLLIDASDAGKAITCTYTNTPKTVTLVLVKAWGANKYAGDVASIDATSGGFNNTAPFTATAPSNATGAGVVVAAGNAITLPAETMPNGTLSNYNTTVSCAISSGTLNSTLVGTNGQQVNTLNIAAADTNANKTITCTYTNTLKTTTLQLRKTWGAFISGNVANIGVTAGGLNNTAAFNSTAGTTSSSNTVTILAGNTITLPAETMPTGSLTNYTTGLSCTAGGAAMSSTLSGTDGQAANVLAVSGADAGKAILCVYANAAKTTTLQLRKVWAPGAISGNVARIGPTTGGAGNTTLFNTTAPAVGLSNVVTVLSGNTITLPAETVPTGSIGSYTTGLSCTADGGPTDNTLSGTNGQAANTLLIGPDDAGKAILCTYTNTPKTTTLQLRKVWAATSPAGDVASIGTTAGGTNNTPAFTATAPAVGDSGAAVAVSYGDTITFPAEAMSAGALGNYTTVLSCTANGGATTNTLTGTDGQVATNKLLIGATDVGQAIVCTYTNTPKTMTLRLAKAWGAGSTAGNVANIGATTGGLNNTAAFTSTASTNTNGAAVTVQAGNIITLPPETMSVGQLSRYNTVLSCAVGGSIASALSGTDGQTTNTLTLSGGDAGKLITCTYTNTPRPTTLQLVKTWNASSIAGDVASFAASTGGAANTPAFTATAPLNGSSGAAVTVQTGNAIVLPKETLSTGTLANYATVLSCKADGGAMASAVTGTNGQANNTLTVASGDAGKAIVCTYANIHRPTVQIRKQALGGTGTFAFSGGNGFGTDSISISVPGATASGVVKTLAAANTQTVLSENLGSMPPGFTFSSASCTGLTGGATASIDLVAGTVTLPAAGLANDAVVVCTFTNSAGAATVSGRVFLDNGTGGGTANDGVPNGSEAPLSGVTVRLTNCAATVHASTLTDAAGNYSLAVPAGTAAGASLCVEETNPGTRVSTGASVGSVALPSGTATSAIGGTYTYTRAAAPDRIAFAWNGTGHSNLNFGDVDNSSFATDGAKTAQPGSTVTYAHTFTAGTAGQVSFAIVADMATPAVTGWTTKIFADPACTGSLQAGAAQLYPPSAAGTPVAFAGKVCVIVQTFVPATAPQGANDRVTVQASFDYTNASPSLGGTFVLNDVTTVSNVALDLKKEVRNVTQGGAFGINNQAKSGETVEYRITYTNNGDAPIRSMTVNDATPGYTSFVGATTGATPATLTACAKNTPANALPAVAVPCASAQPVGGTGPIEWRFTGSVDPGGTGTVLFQVKVD